MQLLKDTCLLPAFLLYEIFLSKIVGNIFPSLFTVSVFKNMFKKIHVFTFTYGCLIFYQTASKTHENAILDNFFKFILEEDTRSSSLRARACGARCLVPMVPTEHASPHAKS